MRLTLIISTLLGAALPAAAQDLFSQGQYAEYQPDLANGEVLFNAGGCSACHGVDGDDRILAGGREFETRFGTLFAPNITAHSGAGIGDWSRADFLNAMLRGRAPDGRQYYGAVFPFPAFSRMQPEDALDLQAFIATLPQSDARSDEHEISLLDEVTLGFYSNARSPLTPQTDPQLERGAYLVEAVGHCGECHSQREFTLSEGFRMNPEGRFAGAIGFFGGYARPINAERLTSEGTSPADFINGTLAQGLALNGLPMAGDAMRRISRSTSRLSHEDRVSIYAYLVGEAVDPASVPRLEFVSADTRSDASPVAANAGDTQSAAPAAPDMTGATDLMAQATAMCEAQAAPPVVTQAAATSSSPSVQADPALASAADEVLETHCRTCHGRGRTNERSFLTGSLAEMARDRGAVVPGDHAASRLWESIASERMPTGRLPRVSADELQVLARWIDSLAAPEPAATTAPATQTDAAPVTAGLEMPRYIGGEFLDLTLAAASDLGSFDEFDRPFIRYLSVANVPLPDLECGPDGQAVNPVTYLHAAVNKLVNSLSRGPVLRRVAPVAGTDGALVRLDMRDLGWTHEDWEALTTGVFTQGSSDVGFTRDAWERRAAIYPYAVDPQSDPMLGTVASYTGATVPILNADWLARHGTEAPYYDLLLRLPPHITQLEQRMGVDVFSEISSLRTVRAGFLAQSSGVSDHNRLLERFDLPGGGYYWKSYDFAGDTGEQSLLEHPDGPPELPRTMSGTAPFEHDGGEMIFTLDNGMQGYYLSLADGTRIFEGPTQIVSFRARPVGQGIEIINARSCFTCHDNGVISKRDEMREFIETSSRFSFDAREMLLRMFPPQERLDEVYRRDVETYLSALQQIGVTELTASGRPTSLRSPEGGEIVTWLADHRFDRLDEPAVARMFHLTPEEFRQRGARIGDPHLQQVMRGWLNRFDQGLMVTIDEVDEVWAVMLPQVSRLRAFDYHHRVYGNRVAYVPPAAAPSEPYQQAAAAAVQQAVEQSRQEYQAPAVSQGYQPPATNADPLQILLHVPRQTVRVNELLSFEVSTNRACTLQVVYVAANRDVLVLSEQAVGPAQMQAGERRQIPYPAGGRQLRFDAPGTGEFLLAYCREASSGMPALSVEDIVRRAREDYAPLSRSLVEEAATRTDADAGLSGFASVSIDVLP